MNAFLGKPKATKPLLLNGEKKVFRLSFLFLIADPQLNRGKTSATAIQQQVILRLVFSISNSFKTNRFFCKETFTCGFLCCENAPIDRFVFDFSPEDGAVAESQGPHGTRGSAESQREAAAAAAARGRSGFTGSRPPAGRTGAPQGTFLAAALLPGARRV